jgi:Bax protein
LSNQSLWRKLLRRVDIIPVSLIIAQAAYESDWGRSRFAKEGLNYFGQRCTVVGCGIIPKNRAAGEIYEVKKFPDVLSSIQGYIHNLNTHSAYMHLRKIRERQRLAHHKLQGEILAQGLFWYSERYERYVIAIRKIIKYYGLWKYDVK